jgi:hypothetical protein
MKMGLSTSSSKLENVKTNQSRHPGPPEADELQPGSRTASFSWIPAFAGMTDETVS